MMRRGKGCVRTRDVDKCVLEQARGAMQEPDDNH
jgi:hypothetical protein